MVLEKVVGKCLLDIVWYEDNMKHGGSVWDVGKCDDKLPTYKMRN